MQVIYRKLEHLELIKFDSEFYSTKVILKALRRTLVFASFGLE